MFRRIKKTVANQQERIALAIKGMKTIFWYYTNQQLEIGKSY